MSEKYGDQMQALIAEYKINKKGSKVMGSGKKMVEYLAMNKTN
jgi:hypothetical protein